MLDRSRPIEPVGVPEINCLYPKSFEALFTGNRHISRVATKPKPIWPLDSAELSSEEYVFALLGIQGQPLANDDLGVALPLMILVSEFVLWFCIQQPLFRSYIYVAAVPESASQFVCAIEYGKTLRVWDGIRCSRTGKSYSHGTISNSRHHGPVLAQWPQHRGA